MSLTKLPTPDICRELALAGAAGVSSVILGTLVVFANPSTVVIAATATLAACIVTRAWITTHRHSAFSLRVAADPFGWLAVGSLCLALVLITWNGLRAAPGLAAADVCLVVAGIAMLVRIGSGAGGGIHAPWWLIAPPWILLLVALTQALLHAANLSTMFPALRLCLALVLTPLVIGTVAGTLGGLWLLVDLWLVSVFVNCAVAVSDYFVHTEIGPTVTGIQVLGRSAGLTTQENHLALVAVLALPILLIRVIATRGVLRCLYAGTTGVAVLALLTSGSRGGLVGGVLALISVPLMQAHIRVRAIAFLTGGGILALLIAIPFMGSVEVVGIERLLGTTSAQAGLLESNSARSALRDDAIDDFEASPVYGTGFAQLRRAHSVYLQILAAGGVLALGAFLAFWAGAIASGVALVRDNSLPSDLRALAGACAGAIIAWAGMGLVENQLFDRYLFVPIGIIVAIMLLAQMQVPAAGQIGTDRSRLQNSTLAS